MEATGIVQSEKPTKVTLKVKRRKGKHWAVARISKVPTRRNGTFTQRFRHLHGGRYRVIPHSTGRRHIRSIYVGSAS